MSFEKDCFECPSSSNVTLTNCRKNITCTFMTAEVFLCMFATYTYRWLYCQPYTSFLICCSCLVLVFYIYIYIHILEGGRRRKGAVLFCFVLKLFKRLHFLKNNVRIFFSQQACMLSVIKSGWHPRSKILMFSVVPFIQTTEEQ